MLSVDFLYSYYIYNLELILCHCINNYSILLLESLIET